MFRVRIRIRIGKGLSTPDTERKVEFMKREVTVSSGMPDQPLSDANWLHLNARGFDDENAANEFGQRLLNALVIAGAATKLGVDVVSNGVQN